MIPLFKPYMPAELPELQTLLNSGALSYGKWGIQFEELLGNFIGNQNIVVVNSYNSAMLVALTTLGITAGDEVIASPMSCLASNQPLTTLGIKVKWADIDPQTGTLCPESVGRKITSSTKAIIHNHYCGYPGYIDEINKVGRKYGIYVIDDAIEAFGSKYKTQMIGNVGTDVTVFSFQTVRLPNTIDGGAIVFNDDKLFAKSKRTRDYGINRNQFRDEIGEISDKCDISEPGYGATLSEINSYIGCLQLEKIMDLINLQRRNASNWDGKIHNEYSSLQPLCKPYHNPNYWVYGLLTENKLETMLHFRNKGYYASGVHLPNNNYSVFGGYQELMGVNDFYSKFLALPCGWWFDLSEVRNV